MRFSPMLNMVVRAVLLGPPGSGKATISSRLRKDFPIDYVSSGDLMRHSCSASSDEIISKVMLLELNKFAKSNLLVDGFPRTVSQARLLEESFPITCVFMLDVPFDEIINRLKDRWIHIPSGRIYNELFNPPKRKGLDDVTGEALVKREDDQPENLRRRLEKYSEEILPLLKFYEKRNCLHTFKGRYSNELWPPIHKAFSEYVKPLSFTEYGSH